MTTSTIIPIIDFSDFDTRENIIAQQVFDACKNFGLFYIINHSIDSSQIAQGFDLSKAFFELPEEKKKKFLKGEKYEGYLELYSQKSDYVEQETADHKELYDFMPFREDTNPSHLMPIPFLEYKNDIEKFSKDLHALALQILKLLSIELKLPNKPTENNTDLDVDWFEQRHRYDQPLIPGILRFQRYPRGDASKHKDELQAGEHTDFGTITLLFQKDVPGLEMKLKDSNKWIPVPIIENAVIVNVAGMLTVMTHGLLHSAFHRVIFTPEQEKRDRYSIAYFVQPESGVKLIDMPSPIIPKERPVSEDVPNDIIELTSDSYIKYRYQKSLEKK